MPALPGGSLAPVLVFVHGGWWKAAYTLDYGGHFCEALRKAGIATWSLEYRRFGEDGGGFPGTFEDVAAGFNFLTELAKRHPLDLNRVVLAGHSAGGHLAFWLAGRPQIPQSSVLYSPPPYPSIQAVVGLAGAVDLRMTIDHAGQEEFAHIRDEVTNFMGGAPAEFPERYAAGNPGELVPLNVPQLLIQGTEDDQIPAQLPLRWAERGRLCGEEILVDVLEGADHLDVVDPLSKIWPQVEAAIVRLIEG